MKRLVSLREANQHLAHYIHAVEKGTEIILTRRGKPIAKMIPLEENQSLTSQQEDARKRLYALMKKGLSLKGEMFTRDELHER